VISQSALAKLTISAPLLTSDPLVALIVSLCPPRQLTVSQKKKGADVTLEINNDTQTLTYRNAILRSLCGMVLHNQLDGPPYFLLGGNSAPGIGGSSDAALAMAGISSWMSVADSLRLDSQELGKLIEYLDGYLAGRSFLVTSPSATLADLDLYMAIASAASSDVLSELISGHANVTRWLVQCQSTASELATAAPGQVAAESRLPPVGLDKLVVIAPPAQPVPFFFYGDEDDDVVAAAAKSASAAPAAAAGKGGGKKGGGDAGGKGGGGGGGGLTDEEKKAAAEKRAKAKAEKAAKKAKQPKAKQQQQAPAELSVSALDIRVGKIIKAWNHDDAEKLYCEEVDVGEDKPRQIASGLRPFYKLEDMQNRMVLVLCNLKARNLVGFPSHGMVMCASNDDHTKVEFAVPPEGAKIGERVMFEGHDGEPEAENKVAKKKIFDKLAPDLMTDADGVVIWKGAKSSTSAGPCKAVNGMPNAHVA